ncbi:MAG: hypothetical protein WD401_02045 [Thermomicrobiaceae bacterium]
MSDDQKQPDAAERRRQMTTEMERTAFQKKAVSRQPARETLADAVEFFKERGYKSGFSARPNQIYVMGGREGIIPRVNGDIRAQENVGKGKVTMLTLNGFGETLSETMGEYVEQLRKQRKPKSD